LFSNEFIEIYSLVISILGGLLAMYLVFNRESNDNQYLNNLLSVIILSSCFHFIRNFLISSGWIMEAPWVYGSFSMIYLLAPPVTFLYMRGILHDEDYFKKKDLVHFIAPFVQFLLSLKYIFSSNVHKLTIVRSISDSNNLMNSASFNGISYKIFFVAVFLSVLTYSIFCFRELKTRKHFSASKHNRYVFRWTFTVTLILISMAFFMLMNAVITMLEVKDVKQLVFFGPFYEFRLLLFTVTLTMIVYSDGLRLGLPNFARNIRIIQPGMDASADGAENTEAFVSGVLTEQQVQTYKQLLTDFFEHNAEVYTQLQFNLEHLSHATKIPKHHWGYFFRYHSDVSFVDMRNEYRINYAKKIMQLPAFKNYTIEAIGEASGFGSRTTFFNAFKKHHDVSPSDYLEQIKS